ncbi:hypothetical protein CANTEDRAFT_122165 [Yamadazyma tenuis ATCC 10573]|uniref:BHLH domain-containing protein n=1 Tax=Candida tenuis (strain ATCC 10573 / BCRC 21748 / CBS 615 / JCM 9827 / NBRC 10315 / NRRL Y-1498 / VKM Y-70) TaxID=590646 RepID=G3B349_CANTC|nr:uncharacterized protein CANTEDRAFT_122165 [Yamadazyma tenuis ATCC 10573]EGV64078.1 hypothetical protein CANTEDRAFT_122165 [Yamadazyma tenuis ATCC 10573]
MEQYLKDSPSDYSNTNTNETNNNYIDNFDSNFNLGSQSGDDNFNTPTTNGNGIGAANDFSLNIEQPYGGDNLGPSSFTNEPFMDDLDAFQGQGGFGNSQPPKQTVNLDELISPNNNAGTDSMGQGAFLDPQYFSPMGSLSNNNNILSPQTQYDNTSINNNFDLNSGSYLSPQQDSFMSPSGTNFQNSYDTLKSPNFGSYLNSPPHQYNMTSSSIPNTISHFLSPPANKSMLGTSAPTMPNLNEAAGGPDSNSSTNSKGGVPSKQLSKEEKLRRRREFHNAVERRRRDLIKERIKELGVLVPPSLLNPQLVAVQTLKNSKLNSGEINDLLSSVKVKESKANKSTILIKSVDYIIHLKYVLEQQEKTRENLEAKLASLQPGDISSQQQNLQPSKPHFMDDFQNHSQSQYIKEEDNFDPDEFFSEIITGNDNGTGGFR